MELHDIMPRIWKRANAGDIVAFRDLVATCEHFLEEDREVYGAACRKWLELASDRLEVLIPAARNDVGRIRDLFDVHKSVCRAGAIKSFHLFLLYVEWNREPKKKFYVPRRKALTPVVEALQEVADGKLKLLTISLPPGVGKSTLMIFFMCWMAGKHPELPNLTGSHSNAFIRGMYDECLRVMDPQGEYLWHEVFAGIGISNTNAKDCRIDVGERKRFETLQFTTIGTGNAGLYRAGGILYCDDLVSGIEVALSKERLDKLWETYTTDLRQRKIGDCAEVHVSTRWSVHDVLGRLETRYGGDKDAKFLCFPAVDENDESKFDYPYGVGFTTEFYHQQRDIMDDASWQALYMNQPIERGGLVFNRDELRRYFDLPDKEPDAIWGVCDTKDQGKDYAVLPVAYQYGNDFFIEDCICDNGLPDVVDSRLINILLQHKVQMCRFESNSAGGRVAQAVQHGVTQKGGKCKITTKFTSANKITKIIVNSGYIKEHFLFKDDSLFKHNSDYGRMMDMLCTFTQVGKNAHDDAPDAMAMLAEYVQSMNAARIEVFKRPF